MDREWKFYECESIWTICEQDAPWRSPCALRDTEFMASWLNAVEMLEAQSNLSEDTLREWWRSTEEYQTEWPKWEESQKPKPQPKNVVTGQLRITNTGYHDDSGPYLPIGIHMGDLFSVFTRDEAKATEALSRIRDAGYGLVQFWLNLGSLGGDYWAGREIGPEITPDYWGKLGRFSDLLDSFAIKGIYNKGDYKLRSMENEDFAEQLGEFLNTRNTGALVIMGNEAWQTGADDVETLESSIEYFRGACNRVPVSSTSPPSEDAEEIATWCRGDFYCIHGYRDGEDHDRVRHIFSVPWEGDPPDYCGYQDEPTGVGDEVSVKARHCYEGRDVDASHLVALAIQSLMTNQGFNYFCNDGIKLDSADSLANTPGFKEVAQAVMLVPKDIMAWPDFFHFGDSQSGWRVFRPGSGNNIRFDHRVDGDRLFGVLYGDEGPFTIYCERDCHIVVKRYDGSVAWERTYSQGQALTGTFIRSQGGQPGETSFIVSGTLL